jgi:hypothetical protein
MKISSHYIRVLIIISAFYMENDILCIPATGGYFDENG